MSLPWTVHYDRRCEHRLRREIQPDQSQRGLENGPRGSMGLGGASRNKAQLPCAPQAANVSKRLLPMWQVDLLCLDITDVNGNPPTTGAPGYLWEFTHPNLGFSTSGASIVRTGDPAQNGNWFAVFASGPTGPINTTENKFMADSDQNLHIFVLNLMSGVLVQDIDTG